MTDIIANILARLAALEQAVGVGQPARTDDRPRRRLPTVAVAQRYNVVPRTIDRWAKAPELDFPAAEVINRRRYWDEDALDAWDQARIRSSISNAGARPRISGKLPALETNTPDTQDTREIVEPGELNIGTDHVPVDIRPNLNCSNVRQRSGQDSILSRVGRARQPTRCESRRNSHE